MNATEVGKYFYCKNNNLSEIQFHKLTYYAYVWSMVLKENKLFEEKPQAWIHGPVFRSLYDSMRESEFYDKTKCIFNFNDDIKNFLDMIYELYSKFSGNELELMTHSESPWINARGNLNSNQRSKQEISDEDIKEYYKSLLV